MCLLEQPFSRSHVDVENGVLLIRGNLNVVLVRNLKQAFSGIDNVCFKRVGIKAPTFMGKDDNTFRLIKKVFANVDLVMKGGPERLVRKGEWYEIERPSAQLGPKNINDA